MKISGAVTGSGTIVFDSNGQMKSLLVMRGVGQSEHVSLADFQSVVHVTTENQKSLGGLIGGAAIGTLLAGPLGGVIGAWLKGSKTTQVVIISLIDGSCLIAQASAMELAQLMEAIPRAEQLREKARKLEVFRARKAQEELQGFLDFVGQSETPKPTLPKDDPWAFLR